MNTSISIATITLAMIALPLASLSARAVPVLPGDEKLCVVDDPETELSVDFCSGFIDGIAAISLPGYPQEYYDGNSIGYNIYVQRALRSGESPVMLCTPEEQVPCSEVWTRP